jgi:hypothetical protein
MRTMPSEKWTATWSPSGEMSTSWVQIPRAAARMPSCWPAGSKICTLAAHVAKSPSCMGKAWPPSIACAEMPDRRQLASGPEAT